MKDGAREILGKTLGKTITRVVIKTGDKPPRSQLFLIFADEPILSFMR